MAECRSQELRQKRAALAESLPGLSRKRGRTYRLNSDARALDRAGVTREPQELARLGEDQAAAESA